MGAAPRCSGGSARSQPGLFWGLLKAAAMISVQAYNPYEASLYQRSFGIFLPFRLQGVHVLRFLVVMLGGIDSETVLEENMICEPGLNSLETEGEGTRGPRLQGLLYVLL